MGPAQDAALAGHGDKAYGERSVGGQMRAPHGPGLAIFNGVGLAMPGRRVG